MISEFLSQKIFLTLWLAALSAVTFFVFAQGAGATDYRGSTFIIRDPAIVSEAASSSGGGFRMFSSVGLPSIGTSSISSSFILRSGFLYFPIASTPVVSVASGNAQATLSWTASVGSLGWNVGGYAVAQGTTKGGPYAYSEVGNVLSSVRTGLTNDVRHYFVVVAEDAFGNRIASSTEVSATPNGPAGQSPIPPGAVPPPVPPPVAPQPPAVFHGRAYPEGTVSLFRDGALVATVTPDREGDFEIQLSDVPDGSYVFALVASDRDGRRSPFINFEMTVRSGATAKAEGIFFAPTLESDLIVARRGDVISFFGSSYAGSDVTFFFRDETSGAEFVSAGSELISGAAFGRGARADRAGVYRLTLETSDLPLGTYSVRTRARFGSESSAFSERLFWSIGEVTIKKPTPEEAEIPSGFPPEAAELLRERAARRCLRADLNCDGRVDLIDFSILIYWWRKELPPEVRVIVDLASDDGRVDLFDFSVLIYYWTG